MASAVRWSIVLFGATLPALPLAALQITTEHRAVFSREPSTDPDARKLTQLVQQAASHYQALIQDTHQLHVQFYYFDYGSQTQNLGSTRLIQQSNGRIDEVFIQIAKNPDGSPHNWFYDASPDNHHEFNLQTTRVRDLTTSQADDAFNGSVPDALEVGYAGAANSSAASGKFDLYSLVLHEMGHALGMLSTSQAAQNQTADGDYDFQAHQVGNHNTDARIVSGEIGHLRPATTLMHPDFSRGQRRLPSATDLLAIASASSFNQLNLTRVDFAADPNDNDWTGRNWIGGQNPDANDLATIASADHDPTVRLQQNATVRHLNLGLGDTLHVNDHRLTVQQSLHLNDHQTTLRVQGNGAALHVQDVEQHAHTTVELREHAQLQADTWQLHAQATAYTGQATLRVAQRFTNDGTLTNTLGGTTTLETTTPQATLDLDGNQGQGTLDAAVGHLQILGNPSSSNFTGTLRVAPDATLSLPGPNTLRNAKLQLLGHATDSNQPATLHADLRLESTDVQWAGHVHIQGSLDLDSADFQTPADLHLQTQDTLTLGHDLTLTLASLQAPRLELGPSTDAAHATLDWTDDGFIAPITLGFDLHPETSSDQLTSLNASPESWNLASLELRTHQTPDLGERLTLIQGFADGTPPTFANVKGIELHDQLRWALVYTDNGLDLVAAQPGDINLDGQVDFDDAMRFLASYSTPSVNPANALKDTPHAAWQDGDFDGDHDTDLQDALALVNAFNQSADASQPNDANPSANLRLTIDPQTGGIRTVQAVPEPTTFLALATLTTVCIKPGKRRKQARRPRAMPNPSTMLATPGVTDPA